MNVLRGISFRRPFVRRWKFNLMPSIDFDQNGSIDIPISPVRGSQIPEPEIRINPDFNPFEQERSRNYNHSELNSYRDQQNQDNWQKLYQGFEQDNEADQITPDLSPFPSGEIEQEFVQQSFADSDQ